MLSRAKRILKAVLPKPAVDVLRRLRPAPERRPTWDGIYSRLADVPATGTNYDDDAEVRKHAAWTGAALAEVQRGNMPRLWHDALALVAAACGARKGGVRVLDFGGAVGTGFVQLLAALPKNIAIDYHVVELEKMCAAGRRLFATDPRITFHTDVPRRMEPPDIVYANSVLQYVEDYRRKIGELAAVKGEFILLARLAAGPNPTYATRQVNLPGKILPYWLLNRDEVVRILAEAGYGLVYEELADQDYDQTNFPPSHRVGRFRNLLFSRATPSPDRSANFEFEESKA